MSFSGIFFFKGIYDVLLNNIKCLILLREIIIVKIVFFNKWLCVKSYFVCFVLCFYLCVLFYFFICVVVVFYVYIDVVDVIVVIEGEGC